MYMLDAVLVDERLCNSMKRSLARVKIWFFNILCFFAQFHKFLMVFLSRVALTMLWLEDSFNIFILTRESSMNNEYGLGQECCDVDHFMHFCIFHWPVYVRVEHFYKSDVLAAGWRRRMHSRLKKNTF